jgi:hypothetical protein
VHDLLLVVDRVPQAGQGALRVPHEHDRGVGRAAEGQPARSDGPVAVADPPVPVRLIGIAASPSTDGPRRSAILSGLGQVFIVGAGGLVGDQYRVAAVGEDAVELHDETTGRVVRLGLR